MTFGKQVDEPTSRRIIDAAIDLGVTFIDTADMYVNGDTEQIVAQAIKGKRDSVVLASKVGHILKLAAYGEQKFSGPMDLARPQPFRPWEGGDETGPNDIGLSRKHLMQALEGSLKRLGTDYLDLYYAHMPDYDTPIDETLRAMDDLVRQGKVRYLGCSNFRAFQLAKALVDERQAGARALGRHPAALQPAHARRRVRAASALPRGGRRRVPVQPDGRGLSLRQVRQGQAADRRHPLQPRPPGLQVQPAVLERPDFDAIDQLKKVAAGAGRDAARGSRSPGARQPGVRAIVNGATSIEQLEQNIAATEVKPPRRSSRPATLSGARSGRRRCSTADERRADLSHDGVIALFVSARDGAALAAEYRHAARAGLGLLSARARTCC